MKRHGILMKGPLVVASMAKNKNQTRRLDGLEKINENPDDWKFEKSLLGTGEFGFINTASHGVDRELLSWHNAVPGDSIWIRETFNWQEDDREGYNDGWVYRAGHPYPDDWKWRPSIHMPYRACRLEYPIISIRPERLMDISEDDAKNEGVELIAGMWAMEPWKNYLAEPPYAQCFCAKDSFITLWDSVYEKQGKSGNPWVWRIEYDPSKNLKEFPYL